MIALLEWSDLTFMNVGCEVDEIIDDDEPCNIWYTTGDDTLQLLHDRKAAVAMVETIDFESFRLKINLGIMIFCLLKWKSTIKINYR